MLSPPRFLVSCPAGIYSLAQHHAETRAEDAIRGTPVRSPTMLKWLTYCCNVAMAGGCCAKKSAGKLRTRLHGAQRLLPSCGPTRICRWRPPPATPAYCPTKETFAKAAGCKVRGCSRQHSLLWRALWHGPSAVQEGGSARHCFV